MYYDKKSLDTGLNYVIQLRQLITLGKILMSNNLQHIVEAVLEYVEGNTSMRYSQSSAPTYEEIPKDSDDPDAETTYMCRILHSSDYYKTRMPRPTSMIFDDLIVEIRCEVIMDMDAKLRLSNDPAAPVRMYDYYLKIDGGGTSIVNVVFRANTLPTNATWHHSRKMHFRNGYLRFVD